MRGPPTKTHPSVVRAELRSFSCPTFQKTCTGGGGTGGGGGTKGGRTGGRGRRELGGEVADVEVEDETLTMGRNEGKNL